MCYAMTPLYAHIIPHDKHATVGVRVVVRIRENTFVCNFGDQFSPKFHRFVILWVCCDTWSEDGAQSIPSICLYNTDGLQWSAAVAPSIQMWDSPEHLTSHFRGPWITPDIGLAHLPDVPLTSHPYSHERKLLHTLSYGLVNNNGTMLHTRLSLF